MKAVILAGGSGSRLWPLSRNQYPKQFLKLRNMDKSIFQLTLERCLKLARLAEIYIVTNINYKFLVLGQIEELGYRFDENHVLVEPSGKNTLPAVYYAIKEIQKQGDDIVVVIPSDQLIDDEEKFIRTIKQGENIAGKYLITYGIRPNKPHTGYGYIKPALPLEQGYTVDEFKEKPDYETALNYVENGYLWNSGMFMFRTDIFTEEVKRFNPEVYEAFKSSDINEIYERTPNISIDYGVMEKTERVAVIPLNIRWSDLGSFDAFYERFDRDENGNIAFNGDILIDSSNNLLYTNKDKTVALIGVEDLIVVDQKDALLLCKKDQSQKVKEVVDRLKNTNNPRVDFHLTTYRPWGSYTILEEGLFYKIKRITVLPGKKLSYQLHHHRSEHWIVVKGTAMVTVEGVESFVRSGESTFVKTGYKHRLENPGKVSLEVIEVQLGEYLEEDDIVRFDDDFGRATSNS
ncbi:mannose-1-phosphate guanylyltransferase/mannose-6-phosphate isomerase [Desulfallas thermosapovorans]|uniref:mannose-1-phosphate guanylyltransferase n=1 Tax=Desulfallas thermosapovorans DSM 6562 TaxID=1121431 RepID=A0A5S4ZV38_9FIRM|nr:mannose-1-phosphate guanylyltransferase/mannose-6-phosphate isomerase [Desulfallas thermosapovorans]TYO96595.1 mannose-1-phosphate guanylyltransferase (GDP) /mannose-6-phosphate isomerase type 2 [Desulfallas thermosapovorans DSM 6562]